MRERSQFLNLTQNFKRHFGEPRQIPVAMNPLYIASGTQQDDKDLQKIAGNDEFAFVEYELVRPAVVDLSKSPAEAGVGDRSAAQVPRAYRSAAQVPRAVQPQQSPSTPKPKTGGGIRPAVAVWIPAPLVPSPNTPKTPAQVQEQEQLEMELAPTQLDTSFDSNAGMEEMTQRLFDSSPEDNSPDHVDLTAGTPGNPGTPGKYICIGIPAHTV